MGLGTAYCTCNSSPDREVRTSNTISSCVQVLRNSEIIKATMKSSVQLGDVFCTCRQTPVSVCSKSLT